MTSDLSAPGEVHLISGAPQPHSDDLDRRIRRYLFSMAVRTACVVLAVVVSGPLRWVFVVGAVILPYIAVVMANAVGGRRGRPAAVAPIRRTVVSGTVHAPAHSPLREGDLVDDAVRSGRPDATSTERVIPGSHERSA